MYNENKNHKKNRKNIPKATYRYRKNNKTYNIRIDRIVATLVILIVLIILFSSCVKSCGKSSKKDSGANETTTSETINESVENTTAPDTNQVVTVSEDQVYCGDLILVDGSNPYQFNENDLNLTAIADMKNDYYSAADLEISLDSNVISHINDMMEAFYNETSITDINIISAYRSYETQESKYASGSANTAPGYSEFHTGRAFSMGIFSSSSSDYFKPDGSYSWIAENAKNYGFILRYPEGKDNITGESYISHIYRYVGIPHATYIADNNICLEEYIDLVKNYTIDSPLAITAVDGSYEVYYQAKGTSVEVPQNSDYTISGNNSDGYIITVKLS